MAEQTTVEIDGLSVTSNHESEEAMRAAFAPDDSGDARAEPSTGTEGAPPSQTETEPVAAPAAKPDKRTRQGRTNAIQAEIDAALERKRIAIAEAEAEEARVAQMRAQRPAAEPPAAAAAVRAEPQPVATVGPAAGASDDPEPNPDDLTKYPDGVVDRKFMKDLGAWQARQTWRELEARTAQQQHAAAVEQHQRTLVTNYASKMQAAIEKNPDLPKLVPPALASAMPFSIMPLDGSMGRPTPLNFIADAVLKSDAPDAVLTALADPANKDLYQRLTTLPPDAIYREIGKLESRFGVAPTSSGPAPKPLALSTARPLIKPVSNAPVVSDDVDEADLSVEDFVRRGNARDQKLRIGQFR